jgi:hypothetical protein
MAHREDKHMTKADFAAFPIPYAAWDLCQRRRFTAVGMLPPGHTSAGALERWSESCRRQWPPNSVNVLGSQERLSCSFPLAVHGPSCQRHPTPVACFPLPNMGVPQSMPNAQCPMSNVHRPVERPRFEESKWPLSGERHHVSPSSPPYSPSSAYRPATALSIDVWLHVPRPYPVFHIPDGLYESSGWIPFTIHAPPTCIGAGSSMPLHIAFLCLPLAS